ncbi:MAG: hypothetical protein AAF765_02215 [Bacteroidota bacterium]
MFSFFKKAKDKEIKISKRDRGNFNFQIDLKKHQVDNFFTVGIPVEFISYESDKFRAKSKDGRKTISITNYAKPRNGEIINRAFFEELKLNLYKLFVEEGDYKPYDDLKVTDNFIRKSFKVDKETQYYFTSARIINDKIIITDFIIREIGGYNKVMMPLLEIINDSIKY